MGRAFYQPSHDSLRIGSRPCGRVGRIADGLHTLYPRSSYHQCVAVAKAIATAYPDCARVTEMLAIEGRRCFNYRDSQGNLRRGELK
jgi:hypothetical protein